eukprot:Em0020g434a
MHSEEVIHAEQQPTADIDDSSDDVEDVVDDDDDPDIVEWFDGLGQSNTSNYHPFPSKIFALLFFLVNSPHPMGEKNLSFVWFILKQMGITVPSLATVKKFQLPDMKEPVRHVNCKGIPFYSIPLESIVSQCIGQPLLSSNLMRYPVEGLDTYTEMYHGDAWRNDSRFFSPMVKIHNGASVFLKECVNIKHQEFGTVTGVVLKFYHWATSKDILAHIEILLDLFQFQHMVPDTTVTHLSSDSLISYGIMNVPVSDIVGLATPPVHIVQRVSSGSGFVRMDKQETAAHLASHPLKARADGKRVVMLPLILFSDDTSGNRSKKWHKFESWYLSFAGLPRHLNARIENINFVCSSDSVSPLDLSEPIAQQLTALETEGVFTFDASHQETVLVVAPLMCIVCDNPRASTLLNHLGSAALKHCPRCMTSRQENPDTVCALRTKDMALQQIAQINALLTEADRVGMRKSFGLREDYNPLLYIPADLYLSIPVEVLHTLSLGSCKHILKDVMPKMSPHQKREIQARVRAFNTSGFSTKLHGSVCYYYQSFVGRDFKGWTQMALFILGPYLSDGQKEVLLAYSKVFRIAYCDFFKPVLLDEWKSVCQAFVSTVKQHMPSLLEKQKTHLILHLVDSMVKFGPCSSFSAERFESFNSNVRMYNVFGNRLAPSRDIAKRFCTLQHLRYICHGGNASERCGGALKELYFTPLLQHMVRGISMRELLGHKAIYQPGVARKCGMQYDIVLGMFALTDKVLEHRSVVSQNTVLVSSGDYVELVISQCNMKYGILLTTFTLSDGSVHCLVQGFHELTLPDGQPLVNEYDCPLMDLSTTIFCTAGNNIQRPVSFVHQCSGTCLFKETGASIRNVERDIVQEDTLIFKHDWNNTMYCYNVYYTL